MVLDLFVHVFYGPIKDSLTYRPSSQGWAPSPAPVLKAGHPAPPPAPPQFSRLGTQPRPQPHPSSQGWAPSPAPSPTPVLKAGHPAPPPAPPQFSRLGTQGPAFLFFRFVRCVFCVLCVLEVLSLLLSLARMLYTCFFHVHTVGM